MTSSLHTAYTEKEMAALADAAKPDNKLLATSRMRQAWRSLKRTHDEDVIKRSGLDATDMDELLAASVLEDTEARHWARYRMTWPPGVAPADTQVFRIVREIGKRTLSDREVLKVKTQAHQQCAVRSAKAYQGGGGQRHRHHHPFQGQRGGGDAHPPQLLLHPHHIVRGLQQGGVQATRGCAGQRAQGHGAHQGGGAPTRYPHALRLPRAGPRPPLTLYQQAPEWVKRKDEAERAVWVDWCRNSTDSFGEVIHQALVAREAMWEVLAASESRAPAKQAPPPPEEEEEEEVGARPPRRALRSSAGRPRSSRLQRLPGFSERQVQQQELFLEACCRVVLPGGRTCGARYAAKDHR